MNNLHSYIIDKNTDYKYFFNRVVLRDTEKETIKKSLYLTYESYQLSSYETIFTSDIIVFSNVSTFCSSVSTFSINFFIDPYIVL